jgi:GxxExxY protein
VDDKVIVEIKSVNQLEVLHEWQVLSYFAATPYEVALLINFGKSKLV